MTAAAGAASPFARVRRFTGLFASNAIGTVVGQVAQIVAIPIQLHSLGAEQFGVMVLFTSFVMAGSVVDAGVGPTTLRFVARCAGRPRLMQHVIASSLSVVVLVSSGVAVAAQAIVTAIIAIRGDPAVAGTDLHLMAALVAIGIAMSMFATVGVNTLRGLRRYTVFAICESAYKLLQPVILTLIAVATRDVTAMLIGYCMAIAGLALLMLVFATRQAGVALRLTTNLRYFRTRMASFSKWVWLQALFGYVGSQADRFVVASFLNLSTLGYYAIALSAASALSAVANAGAGFLLPEAAGRRGQDAWLRTTFRTMTFLFAAASAAAVLLFTPLAGPVLGLWLGAGAAGLVLPFLIPLLWSTASAIASIPGTQLLNAVGRARFGAVLGVVNNSLMLVAILIGGWAGGATGIVIGRLLAIPIGFGARVATAGQVFAMDRPVRLALAMLWPILTAAPASLCLAYFLYR